MMRVSELLYILEYIMKENTGVRLEGWTNARNSKKQYRNQLRNFSKVCTSEHSIQLLTKTSKTDSIKNICRLMAIAGSQNWKFSIRENGDVEAKEVILRIQGIICN